MRIKPSLGVGGGAVLLGAGLGQTGCYIGGNLSEGSDLENFEAGSWNSISKLEPWGDLKLPQSLLASSPALGLTKVEA